MSEFRVLETYSTFEAASRRAQALAIQCKQQTGVRRNADTWEILGTFAPRAEATNQLAVRKPESQVMAIDDEEECFSEEWADGNDEQELLIEEMDKDRESAARSESEGWYYEDEDAAGDTGNSDSQFGRFQAPRDAWGRILSTGSGW